ncbi:hypothetical protein GCM10023346_13940 [Arthrobacter gyeryongensis]|uniref:Uncharacterized protein n=1 Tax=Arthrobacter gyeryongensis TaxID=1650592 RepID=A0ABP9S851_9MICC
MPLFQKTRWGWFRSMAQEFGAPDDDQRTFGFQPAPWMATATSRMAPSNRLDSGPHMAGSTGGMAVVVAVRCPKQEWS